MTHKKRLILHNGSTPTGANKIAQYFEQIGLNATIHWQRATTSLLSWVHLMAVF